MAGNLKSGRSYLITAVTCAIRRLRRGRSINVFAYFYCVRTFVLDDFKDPLYVAHAKWWIHVNRLLILFQIITNGLYQRSQNCEITVYTASRASTASTYVRENKTWSDRARRSVTENSAEGSCKVFINKSRFELFKKLQFVHL